MNSTPNLINPQRFHVLIPKVKGVIVLTNEVNVSPSGNTGTAVRPIETEGKRIKVRERAVLSVKLTVGVQKRVTRATQIGLEVPCTSRFFSDKSSVPETS